MYLKRFSFLLLLFMDAGSLFSQPLQMQIQPTNNTQIYVKYLHPSFKAEVDLTAFSGSYEMTLNTPLSEYWNIFATLPYFSYSVEDIDQKDNGIGNLLLGVQWRKMHSEAKQSTVSIGIGLPTAKKDISFLGLLTHFYSNVLYAYDFLPIYTNYAYNYYHENGFLFSAEFGPDMLIYTGDNSGQETEIILHYSGMVGFETNQIGAYAEFLGNMALTEDELITASDNGYVHSLTLGLSWQGSTFRPGLYYQTFLTDNMKDIFDSVFGISLGFVLETAK